ncbi:MAG: GAF domain-containing protein [Lachnospiraceae bacterium]|nr:GAF domain-containing protein [Lachnospiraceae bacterium]
MKTKLGTPYSLERMISIALDLSAEKDFDRLMKKILSEAMDTCHCDAGTVYLLEDGFLHFHTFFTKSKQISSDKLDKSELPPPVPMVRSHVCACCAMDRKKINLPDIYKSEEYDFRGAQKYDAINDYHTGSMLVIPMSDEKDDVIGVLQLINALDSSGNIIPFDEDYEEIVQALASLAAVSINNHKLAQEISDLLQSFVQVMVGAIDTRTPYNASHTRSMVRYGERFIKWLNDADKGWSFTEEQRDAFLMSVWLHDIGKLLVPLNVLDKADRLSGIREPIVNRIEIGCLKEEIQALRDPSKAEESRKKEELLRNAWETIEEVNNKGFLDDETLEKLHACAKLTCKDANNNEIPLLTEKELTALSVRKGTLTESEKSEVEKHVVYTAEMLDKMNFKGTFKDVPHMAGSHHEFVNGSGYPKKLSGTDLSDEIRLLTVLDIYDALTAEDRPYKPPIAPEKAFKILYSMCEEGKLDERIVKLFEESGAWSGKD